MTTMALLTSIQVPYLSLSLVDAMVDAALAEDLGAQDVTAALVPARQIATATVITREAACLSGMDWFTRTFARLDANIQVHWHATDGESVAADTLLCTVKGPARAILSGERTALNFMQLLSGTATTTQHHAQLLAGTHTRLLDTRKTLPGLRLAQKYAVRCGGGDNHRLGLYDAFLIKENHIAAVGTITQAVLQARVQAPGKPVEIEVERLDQLEEAIACQADIVLLDNFSEENLRKAIVLAAGRIKLEVSGNVDYARLSHLAQLGIDYISMGALTKHVHAIDLSMRFSSHS